MKVAAWKNGKHQPSGTSYGLSISPNDRDKFFDRNWGSVIVILPNGQKVTSNIDKDSFWEECPHLISRQFAVWFYQNDLAPWLDRQPPNFRLKKRRDNVFNLDET